MGKTKASSSLERLFLSIGCSTFTNGLADLPADSDVYTFTRHAKRTFDGDGKQQAYSLSNPDKQEALDWLTKHTRYWSGRAAEDAVLILFLSTHGFKIQNQTCFAYNPPSAGVIDKKRIFW